MPYKNYTNVISLVNTLSDMDSFLAGKLSQEIDTLSETELIELDDIITYFLSVGYDVTRQASGYLLLLSDQREGFMFYQKEKKYRYSKYNEVDKLVYHANYMEGYMIGLALSKRLDHIERAVEQYYRLSIPVLLDTLSSTGSYLEVGCGHGLMFEYNYSHLALNHFLAVDISQKSVELTCRLMSIKVTPSSCKTWDVQQLDFLLMQSTDTFSLIVMGEVLEHVEQPLVFLNKANELLVDDGLLYITVPMHSPMIDHIYLFRELEDIFNLTKQAGFEVVDCLEATVNPKYSAERCHKMELPSMAAIFLKKRL